MHVKGKTYMSETERSCLSIVLAAGEGTRMQSARPKVLHEVAGLSLLGHVLKALGEAGSTEAAVVVGPDRDDVAKEARSLLPGANIYVQHERLGTAHAVLAAREAIAKGFDDIIIAFADTPLVTAATFNRLRAALAHGAPVVVLGFESADPTGYGRLIVDKGELLRIVEERDATDSERAVTLCNAGLMALNGRTALELLNDIDNANAKGEYYLTDIVAKAREHGGACQVKLTPEDEVSGVNDRVQLSQAEHILQQRLRLSAMRAGATLIAPETVYFAHDTKVGRDVLIEPNVVFGPGVTLADGVTVHAFSHLEGATLASGASVGPFARLRPGTELAANVKIGNFVETKNAKLAAGVKASHLSYLGDTVIGEETNIGAGTITCNYDGFLKYQTTIGKNVFIGSNSALVAPITIGDGAMVAAGSTLGGEVEADALAIVRAQKVIKPGASAVFRKVKAAEKAAKAKG